MKCQGADLRTKAGDDGAAKLCVFFDFPADRLSFAERAKLTLARAASGEDVPSEVLCYVWDNKEPKGTSLVPVGGISPDNMQPFLDAGVAGFGLGSGLFKPGMTVQQVADNAKAYVQAWQSLKG